MDTEDHKLSLLMKDHEPDYINDAGFSGRVMAALPPPRRRQPGLRRALLILGACILSAILPPLLGGKAFMEGLSTAIQLSVDKPLFTLGGIGFATLPVITLSAGLLIACAWSRKMLRE